MNRQHLNIVSGRAGALGGGGDRGRLHREAGFHRGGNDPVGEHAFAAERGDQQPLHAHGAQRLLDAHAGRGAVALVEQVRGDAGDDAIVPEAAVAPTA
ncbi:MAG: hypothetical protein P8Z80_10220 [Pseudolabrys sp.]